MDQEALDSLKLLDEWESMINLFANDLEDLKDAMVSTCPEERLTILAAKAQMAKKYLDFALEKPESEEG